MSEMTGGLQKEMEKKNFVSLLFSVVGLVLFALGMCMCLLPEWNAFNQGLVLGCAGLIVLLIMVMVRRKMEGKPIVAVPDGKTIGAILLTVVGVLTLGVGMCLVMVWTEYLMVGVVIGLIGIVLLLCLIPILKGIH